jgi:hypothetical protein
MIRNARIILAMLLVFGCIAAEGVAQQATIFPMLRAQLSGRAAGLAGATVAMTDDASMVMVNPASLATVQQRVVTATFLKHVLDINSGFAVYADTLSDVSSWAVSASVMSFGDFVRTDRQGTATGSFVANDVALAATYASHIDTLITYGVTAKLLYSTLDNMQSTAVAVDAGILIQIPRSRTNVGLSILNAGTQLSTYDGVTDRLPLDVRIGVNHRLKGLPLLVQASINHLADDVDSFGDRFLNFSVAGELYIGSAVQARLGYDNSTRNTSDVNVATQLTGLSGGLGVVLNDLRFDYALGSMGSAALLHRLTAQITL